MREPVDVTKKVDVSHMLILQGFYLENEFGKRFQA